MALFWFFFCVSIQLVTNLDVTDEPVTSIIDTTVNCCGDYVTGSFGNITSPKYPDHYDDLLNCKWEFFVPAGNRIMFQFYHHFSTELGYDRLTIHDGESTASPVILETSGKQSNSQIFVTSGNKALVRFTSDSSINHSGFVLYYSTEPVPVCGGLFHTDGTIESPDFPAHYPSSTTCRWIIKGHKGKKIELNFKSFQTEPGRDTLTVLDPSVETPLIVHSGFTIPDSLVSHSNQLLIIFHSDYFVNQLGFEVAYKII